MKIVFYIRFDFIIFSFSSDIISDKQRETLFHIQMKDVETIARDLMSSAGSSREEFTIAKHLEHVRPMFQRAWSPCLAAFSVGLQDSDQIDLAHLCLTGISYAIRIACIFRMEVKFREFDRFLYISILFSSNEMHLFKRCHVLHY